MAAVSLTPDDLSPFAEIDSVKAQAMIDDALALAARVAPCILEDAFTDEGAAKAILRGAILRWNEAGTGALTQQTAGIFSQSVDTRIGRRSLFWPSEITALAAMCGKGAGKAYEVATMSADAGDGYWSAPDTWVPL